MCITFIYINNETTAKTDYQVVIAFNRDEFYSRPALPAHFWNEHCISGLDMQPGREGGTWFGASSKPGRIAALLNILQNFLPLDKKARGRLVVDYLVNNADAKTYLDEISQERYLYNPFNLLLLEKLNSTWSMHYYCPEDENTPIILSNGVFAFGNTTLDQQWRKVTSGKERFEKIINAHNSRKDEDILKTEIFNLMSDRSKLLPNAAFDASMQRLPNIAHQDGRSAIFVDLTPETEYGTRTTTLVLVDAEGRCSYSEKTMKEFTAETDERFSRDTSKWEASNFTFAMN